MTPHLEKIIHNIRFRPKDRLQIFKNLPPGEQAEVCLIISKHLAYEVLSPLPDETIVDILEHLGPDEATDILQLFSKTKQNHLLEKLSEEIKNAIKVLIKYDPETAGGLMDLNYIQVNEEDAIAEVAKKVNVHEKRTGRLPAILVMRKNGQLNGYLPGHKLGFANPKDKVGQYVRHIKTILYTAQQKDIIEIFRAYPHNKMVVLSQTGGVLGIIYSDDVLRLLREQEAQSLYDFAGVSEEENVLDNASKKIHFRYKWLIVNLATAFLAAFTVGLFNQTIAKYVLLAVYMPIVAGMGGNAATQTLAVMVRGISLKQITSIRSSWRVLRSEIVSGFSNGVINGAIVAAVVILVNHDLKIAAILAFAMVANLIVAATFGTIIPVIMKELGKDPASSATIFITTATDVLGFLVFLGLASLILT